jgi:hypothetical protein
MKYELPEGHVAINFSGGRTSGYELNNFVSRQGDWLFDDEAYLCQQDHGECTG